MLPALRGMPNGVRFFLAYGIGLLVLIGVSLPGVIDLAVETPVTGPGLVAMLLLAYTVFTLTLVLQRKRAAYWLAIGLSSLTVPLAVALAVIGAVLPALAATALAAGLFVGLGRPASRAWLDQE